MLRSAQLVRRSVLKRRARMAPVSAMRAATRDDRAAVREAVFERDHHQCQFPHDRVAWLPCMGGLTFHHICKASQGGPYSVANGLALCAAANTWVEDHPDEAYRLGLVQHVWEADNRKEPPA